MHRLEQYREQLASLTSALSHKPILQGRYIRRLPLQANQHYQSLYENLSRTPEMFDFLLETAPSSSEDYRQWLKSYEKDTARWDFVIELIDQPGDYVGLLCLAKADPQNRKIELELRIFSRKLQKTPASTESQYLLLKFAFQNLGYNRVQALASTHNAIAISNLMRFGFVKEATLRHHIIFNGQAQDWLLFSLLKAEWQIVKGSIEAWLDPTNFDSIGDQKKSLSSFYQCP